jgi:hypothetical protein
VAGAAQELLAGRVTPAAMADRGRTAIAYQEGVDGDSQWRAGQRLRAVTACVVPAATQLSLRWHAHVPIWPADELMRWCGSTCRFATTDKEAPPTPSASLRCDARRWGKEEVRERSPCRDAPQAVKTFASPLDLSKVKFYCN